MKPKFLLSFFHDRRPFCLTAAFFFTQIRPPPPPPRPASQPIRKDTDNLHYLQSFYTLYKTLSKNPRSYTSLKTLDSLLTESQFFDSATSVAVIDYLSQLKKLVRAKPLLSNLKSKGKVSDYFLYSLVIDCLVKDGKIDDVETVWAEVCEPHDRRIDISDYVLYVSKYGIADEIKGISERVLKGGRVLERQSYLALIGALCRENEGFLAKQVVEEMCIRGIEVDDLTCFVLFQCFCRNGDVDEADLVLRNLVRRKFHIDVCVYGNFMYALCKSGKFREANKLFQRLVKKDCARRDKSVEFLKEGRRAIFQLNSEGAVPEIMAHEAYFRSLCCVGKLDEAEALLKKMMQRRTVLEICVYVSFIKALFRAGRDEDAMKFFKVERKKGLVQVDEIANYVVVGLCEKGKVDDAWRIFEEIIVVGGSVRFLKVCNCILSGYWREGRVDDAECLFERLRSGKFCLPDVLTYTTMVNGYCNHGNVRNALSVLKEMLDSDMVIGGCTYEIVIRALCARGRLKEGLKYINYLIENGNLVSWNRWKVLLHSNISCN